MEITTPKEREKLSTAYNPSCVKSQKFLSSLPHASSAQYVVAYHHRMGIVEINLGSICVFCAGPAGSTYDDMGTGRNLRPWVLSWKACQEGAGGMWTGLSGRGAYVPFRPNQKWIWSRT
eukprot:647873-Ditylum_brightwellii.AAC.1